MAYFSYMENNLIKLILNNLSLDKQKCELHLESLLNEPLNASSPSECIMILEEIALIDATVETVKKYIG